MFYLNIHNLKELPIKLKLPFILELLSLNWQEVSYSVQEYRVNNIVYARLWNTTVSHCEAYNYFQNMSVPELKGSTVK